MAISHLPSTSEAVVRAANAMDSSDALDSAVIATDNSGTVLYWNEGAEKLFGWPSDDAVDRNIVDVMRGQQTASDAEAIMHQLLAGKTWSGSFLARHRDGALIRINVTDVPVKFDGSVVGIVGVSRRA
jgi:PAS domain S-box-containing protein